MLVLLSMLWILEWMEGERPLAKCNSLFRAFDDEKKAKMGVTECARHELLSPYPVLYEKDGEFVAQIKCTVLLMPNGPLR